MSDALWGVQIAALSAFALFDSGIRLFCAAPRRGHWPLMYPIAAMLFQTFLPLTQTLHVRIIANSFLLIPIFIDAALPLMRIQPAGSRFPYRFTATALIFGCVASCIRIAAVLFHLGKGLPESPYFSANPANTVFFALMMILCLSLGFGINALTHERLMVESAALFEQFVAESRERVRVEHQLAMTERLAAVGRLATGVAHFFNNELYAIQLASSLFRESLKTPGTALSPFIDEIDQAVSRTSNIVKQLRQYAQTRVLHPSRFDPWLLVEEMLPVVHTVAGERVEVNTVRLSTIPLVEIDADLLKETVLTLVQNAHEAMASGGKLSISLDEVELKPPRSEQLRVPSGEYVVLSVADTGSGMDDQTLKHVFEPFFTTKSFANAEGLGLANAYGFVRQSGGAITVHSMPKRGSTFEIYLPQVSTVRERAA
jgi:signal transduction histidine kinase